MNATQNHATGVRPVALRTSKSELKKSNMSSTDTSGSSKSWMCGCDEKWINHYNAEWQAFIEAHSSQKSRAAGNFSADDALPCVWNIPAE